jgi:hypothetical protein
VNSEPTTQSNAREKAMHTCGCHITANNALRVMREKPGIERCPLHEAAPELLEALEELVAPDPEFSAWARARFAISKAKGERQ